MNSKDIFDKLDKIHSDLNKKEKKTIGQWILSLTRDLLLPASVVLLAVLNFRASKNDAQSNLQVKYLEIFYNELTDTSSIRHSNAIDLLKLMSPNLAQNLGQWVANSRKNLTITYDTTVYDTTITYIIRKNNNDSLLSEVHQLKSENLRLNESLKLYIEKDNKSKIGEYEMISYTRYLDSLFNRIIVNTTKYSQEESRIVTNQGKIVTFNGKTMTVKVNVSNYNYSIGNIAFKINVSSNNDKIDPLLDILVFFDLRDEKNFKESLKSDLIYISLLTPYGYLKSINSEQYLEIMPFKINSRNQFSFTIPKSVLILGEYKLNFLIDNKEIGEGTFTIK